MDEWSMWPRATRPRPHVPLGPRYHTLQAFGHHGLAGLAAESLAEFRHVLHHAVYPELPWRVRIGLHLQPELFGAGAAAPALSVPRKNCCSGV